MKKEFLPYYISRFILSAVFSILVWRFTWIAAFMTFVFFGLFMLYLHSGWFSIDLSTPLYPLRRDSHGQMVQRKALIVAVVLGMLLYAFAGSLISGQIALSISIVVYFIVQFAFFITTSIQEHLSNQ
ncbi:hypothetical protein ANAEL_00600 [Anaerolineales bacterium]|nr:hypothetical protein ANAEL_00600 [Anaerolineales bacterium]